MKLKMKDSTYDVLKYIVTVALPATEILWLTLGKIWNFPYVVEIGATIAAITAFLGALLHISSEQYRQDGQTKMFNEDMLKDMVHYDEAVEEIEESEESEV